MPHAVRVICDGLSDAFLPQDMIFQVFFTVERHCFVCKRDDNVTRRRSWRRYGWRLCDRDKNESEKNLFHFRQKLWQLEEIFFPRKVSEHFFHILAERGKKSLNFCPNKVIFHFRRRRLQWEKSIKSQTWKIKRQRMSFNNPWLRSQRQQDEGHSRRRRQFVPREETVSNE